MAPNRQQKISWATMFIGHGPFLAANTILTSWLLSTTTLCLVLQRCRGWCHIIVRDRGSNALKYSELPGASGTITILSAQFLAFDCRNATLLSADELISITGSTERGFSTPTPNPLENASLSYEGDPCAERVPALLQTSSVSVSISCARSALATSFLGITTLIAPFVFERRAHKIQSSTYNRQLPQDLPDWRLLRIFNGHSCLFALRF